MELPENMLRDYIQSNDKAKWTVDNNHNIKNFTEDEIKRITSNYSTPIGKGGFGEVYKGVLDDKRLVAVKKYICDNSKEAFAKEVIVHCQINHKNVVRLLGFCVEENALMMVTEYISKGSLHDILHDSEIPISLDTRLGIAIECAEALGYMHFSMYIPVIHGDVKPANILLDDNFSAKVSDFGISRFLSSDSTQRTINVKGSIHYMDPIFLQEGILSPENDVYSFGAVLLELITRKRIKENGKFSLIGSFTEARSKGRRVKELLDADIASGSNMKIVEEIGKLATECFTLDIHKRPKMNGVAARLRILREVHNGGQENLGWQFFFRGRRNADDRESTSVASSSAMARRQLSWEDAGNSEILAKLGNVRIFTKGELDKITKSYSCLLFEGRSAELYKGTLDDNSLVAVKKSKSYQEDENAKEILVNEAMIHSQLIHKNIIKLLGCCLETGIPVFVYEYAAKGNLHDVLHRRKGCPIELRLQIAIGTAEALAYMHSSESGVFLHGCVRPKSILIDKNFTPKVSGFLPPRLAKYDVDMLPEDNYDDSVRGVCDYWCRDPDPVYTVKSDVYNFGYVLVRLLNRRDFERQMVVDRQCSVSESQLKKISPVLEEVARLTCQCASYTINKRPTMEEVTKRLEMIRGSWKQATETDARIVVSE